MTPRLSYVSLRSSWRATGRVGKGDGGGREQCAAEVCTSSSTGMESTVGMEGTAALETDPVGEAAGPSTTAPAPRELDPSAAVSSGAASHAPAGLVSAIVGESAQPARRPFRFSSTHQPSADAVAARRTRFAVDFEPDPKKRSKMLSRHLKTLRKMVELIEKSTGTPIVLLCSTSTDDETGRPVVRHVLGRPDSAIMRACWSDPRCEDTRNAIWDAEIAERHGADRSTSMLQQDGGGAASAPAAQTSAVAGTAVRQDARSAAAPVIDIGTARTQLRAVLGVRPGFGKSDRKPRWWPDLVPWQYEYSLQRMSTKDLGVVHSAFCKDQGLPVQRVISVKAAAKAAAATSSSTAVAGRATGVRPAKSDTIDCTTQVTSLTSESRERESVGLKRGRDGSVRPPIPSRYKVKRGGRDGDDNVIRSARSNIGQGEMATVRALGSGARSSPLREIPRIPTRPQSWQAQCRGASGASGSSDPAAVLPRAGQSTSVSSAEGHLASTAEALTTVPATARRGVGKDQGVGVGVGVGTGTGGGLPRPARRMAASAGGEMAPPAARKPRRQRAYTSFLSLRSEELAPSEGGQVKQMDQDAAPDTANKPKDAPSKPTGHLTI